MSDCDICIGGGFDDYCEVSESKIKTARKAHKCCECAREINRGDQYEHCVLLYEDEWSTYKTCMLCVEIRTVFTCGKSWLFQCLWDDMREYAFEVLTTASKCFTELTPAARGRVLEEWRRWKGLIA